jgi:hypothetical protein
MAAINYEVMFQATLGLPFHQASQEERAGFYEAWGAMEAKWEARGIELVAYIGTQATEYAHTSIYRLKNADQFFEMEQDIADAGDLFSRMEKFSIALGKGRSS